MTKYLLPVITILLILPAITFAASDTVTFTADTNLYLSGLDINIVAKTGSTAAGVTVYSDYIGLDLENGSNIILTGPAAYALTNPAVLTTCNSSGSSVNIISTVTQSINVTPQTPCTIVSGGGGEIVVVAPSGGGGGGGGGDMTAPTISQIAVTTLTDNYAVISWQTNEPSLSWINYGTSASYGLTSKTSVYVSSHSLKLTDLSASTVYHYQVKSQDATGNIGSYTDGTFTTLSSGAAPVITTPVVTTPKPISQMTPTEIQVEISRLTALVLSLQSQLAQLGPTAVPPAAIPFSGKFTTGLSIGAKSDDVRALQEFLKAQGSAIYPEGLVTGYFGSLTEKAVERFQEKYGIAKPGDAGYGYVGPKTRAAINADIGANQ